MSVRPSSRVSRSLGLLVVPAVLAASVVLVPGIASAETGADPGAGSDPGAVVQGALDGVLSGGQAAGGPDGDATPPLPADGLPPLAPPDLGLPGDDGTPDPSTSLTPAELRQLFIQALAPLGITEDCVNGVFDGFEDVIAALTEQGPEDLENLLTLLVGGLEDPEGFDPSALSDSALAEALQGLAETLQEECMPAPPGGNEPPVSPGENTPPTQSPAPVVVATPVAAPVTYPGYAPTGSAPEDVDLLPLAALGGVVLLSAVGAAGYRVSSRGARSRG